MRRTWTKPILITAVGVAMGGCFDIEPHDDPHAADTEGPSTEGTHGNTHDPNSETGSGGETGDPTTGGEASTTANVPPDGTMSFFVTSVGNGSEGGNYGGLEGADARCQALADAAGVADRTWRAYLSTVPIPDVGGELVHARDRIGSGPWYNFDGDLVAADVDSLHAAGISPPLVLTELGAWVPDAEHDVVTGSEPDGTAMEAFPDNPSAPGPTCFNWYGGDDNAWVWVGHADWDPGDSWNSTHATSCSPEGLAATAGSGRLYCFAAD